MSSVLVLVHAWVSYWTHYVCAVGVCYKSVVSVLHVRVCVRESFVLVCVCVCECVCVCMCLCVCV